MGFVGMAVSSEEGVHIQDLATASHDLSCYVFGSVLEACCPKCKIHVSRQPNVGCRQEPETSS